MPAADKNWLNNRPGPLQDTQPRHISFADSVGALKSTRPPGATGRVPLKVPDRKQSGNPNQCAPFNQILGKTKGIRNTSQASNWNAQMPEILFNDHKELLLKHEYRRGMIINAPVHEPMCGMGKSRAPSLFESISAWGGVFTKPRYLIVVGLHETEYTCIPLYSHNQEGLRGKEHYRREFISIRDGRISGRFKSQSDYLPLNAEMSMGPILDPTSVAWLTHPVSRKYDLNLSVCGRLKQESLDRLAQHIIDETNRGLGLS